MPWDSSRAQRGSRSRRLAEVSQQEVRLCSSGGSGRKVSSPLDSAWGRKKSSSFRQNFERNGRDSCLDVQDTKRSLWRAGKGCRSPPSTPLAPILQPPGAEQPPAAHSYETTAAKTGTQQLQNTQNRLFEKKKEKKSTHPGISAMLLEPEPTRRAILLPDPSGFVRSRGTFPHSAALPTLGQPRVPSRLVRGPKPRQQIQKYNSTTYSRGEKEKGMKLRSERRLSGAVRYEQSCIA